MYSVAPISTAKMGLEYFRAFPFIDYVVVGEGEVTFPALVDYVLRAGAAGLPRKASSTENRAKSGSNRIRLSSPVFGNRPA